MDLYAMNDFRSYVQGWVLMRGRGEYRRISLALNMHTTLVSQVFRGHKCLTEEQAVNLCSYMGLNPTETDYFLTLIQFERAGSEALKNIFHRHLLQIRNGAQEVRSQIAESKKLRDEDRVLYYSSWQFCVVRLLTSIEGFQTVDKIASQLELTVSRVSEILDFLTSRGLCKKKGRTYQRTGKNTHVEAQSPLSIRHHQNWRAKSIALQEKATMSDLCFTSPLVLAKKDREAVRKILLSAIAQISKIVEPSPSEELVYLGIDWIKL